MRTAKVSSRRFSYQPQAACDGPDDWYLEITDRRKMYREARKHAAETGHPVRVETYYITTFEREEPGA